MCVFFGHISYISSLNYFKIYWDISVVTCYTHHLETLTVGKCQSFRCYSFSSGDDSQCVLFVNYGLKDHTRVRSRSFVWLCVSFYLRYCVYRIFSDVQKLPRQKGHSVYYRCFGPFRLAARFGCQNWWIARIWCSFDDLNVALVSYTIFQLCLSITMTVQKKNWFNFVTDENNVFELFS